MVWVLEVTFTHFAQFGLCTSHSLFISKITEMILMDEDRKKAFDYLNFSFVLFVAFFAVYPFFLDYLNLDTRSHAVDALYWSMGFVVLVAIFLISYYKIIMKKKISK